MRYPSPVPTQRADYKSAEAKAIALWSRERDGLAYHHRIERNRVYLTACIVSHVCCVFCLQWGGREGQGGATHKKIGPSDGGRLLYRLYFNADRTCNTKEKKKLNRNKDKQSTTEAFHGRRKLSLFFISMAVASTFFGIQKDWAFPFWYEIYAKQTQHFFWHLTHHSSLALCKDMDMHTEELRISPWILHIVTFSHLTSPYLPHMHSATSLWKSFVGKREMGNSFHLAEFVGLDFLLFFIGWVSRISVKCERVTDSSISETLFDFWHSTCHENGTSIQSFDYWSSCPEFPSISNILLILKRRKRRDEHCRFIFLSMWRGGKQ
jgi:hypothetical protein